MPQKWAREFHVIPTSIDTPNSLNLNLNLQFKLEALPTEFPQYPLQYAVHQTFMVTQNVTPTVPHSNPWALNSKPDYVGVDQNYGPLFVP